MKGVGLMKLEKIYLENYRGLELLQAELGGENIVLYGINGAGKTSVLTGISLLFSQIISQVTGNQFRQQISISKNDVRFRASLARIYGNFIFEDGQALPSGFAYKKESGRRSINRDAINNFIDLFKTSYLNEDSMLPVFAYYGVNRAVLDIPLRIRQKHEFGRMEAYQNATSSKTDFRTFFEWFRNQEDLESERLREKRDLDYRDPVLEATRHAIMSMLPELSDIRVMRKPLRMCATKNNCTLRMEQLSDGEKCILAMLGDIARRLALANPNSNNPLIGGGIVLIDEIELHMHPSWQSAIVPTLHKVFPNIQFIITTHSPLVLGGLNEDFKIFGLTNQSGHIDLEEMCPGFYDANMILEDKMETPSISPEVTETETKIFKYIAQQDFFAAQDGISKLSAMTNGTHPTIAKAQILIRRGRFGSK